MKMHNVILFSCKENWQWWNFQENGCDWKYYIKWVNPGSERRAHVLSHMRIPASDFHKTVFLWEWVYMIRELERDPRGAVKEVSGSGRVMEHTVWEWKGVLGVGRFEEERQGDREGKDGWGEINPKQGYELKRATATPRLPVTHSQSFDCLGVSAGTHCKKMLTKATSNPDIW